uniref:STE20-related kinase adapter protein alpha-like n=1 Tax=Saccoglossus kowalevskii TaxID=10224 RepID=A0ABM0GWE8_SACKO|nr:PREDICTED: STE20-related kinase adapter protein alpha-like [Saccoglossus kowalevskii]
MIEYLPIPSHYELLAVIGKGSREVAATIYLARHTQSSTYLAVRTCNLDNLSDELTILQHEFHLLRIVQHENILPFHCAFVHCNELWVVMPLMAYGSAKDVIEAHFVDGLGELAIAFILRDVITALDYIHRMGCVHRSIRAGHMLISADGKCYLSGFRSAISLVKDGKKLKAVHDFPRNAVKSLPWFAPEVLEQHVLGYDCKSDIYSIGITACELANGSVPFSDMVHTKMLLEKINGTTPRLLDSTTACLVEDQLMNESSGAADSGLGSSMAASSVYKNNDPNSPFNRTFSQNFHNFVELCVKSDPDDRPTASALLNHPFFKQTKKRPNDTLVQLLHPVAPLSDASNLPKVKGNSDDVTDELQELTLSDLWNFD